MSFEEEVQKIISEHGSGKKVHEIALEHGLLIAEVFAVLIENNVEFDVPKNLERDYEYAVKEKDKLIAELKKDFENADFTPASSISNEKEEVDKAKENDMFSHEEDIIDTRELDISVAIKHIEDKIDAMMTMMREMQENIGYSKYGSIKKYIQIHETVTVENLTRIFGSYAKNVLYRLYNDGYVQKIAHGIYKYKGFGDDKNGESKKE